MLLQGTGAFCNISHAIREINL